MVSKTESNMFRVVMLPFLAYSHISAFFELAKRIANQNFQIYLCSTPINLKHIKNRVTPSYTESIELVELDLTSLTDLPPQNHTTNGLPLHLNRFLKAAFEKSAMGFADIIEKLKPHLVIYDFNLWWAADVAACFDIPSVQFLTGSARGWCSVFESCKVLAEEYGFPDLGDKSREHTYVDLTFGGVPVFVLRDVQAFLESMKRSHGIILIKSSRELERKYIENMSKTIQKNVLPIGPLFEESLEVSNHEQTEIFKWLDNKQKSSVVFVSFGSECYLSENQIEELAYGLESSNISFIWVIRFPNGDTNSLETVLPLGFLDRLGPRCMVLTKWAPQTKILNHSSTGGFVSHCGWNSIMESVYYGVPVIGMPMHYDQPENARLLEEIGVGVVVGRDEDGVAKREEIAEAVMAVVAEDGGGDIRKKTMEFSRIIRQKGDDEVERVVKEDLVKICELKKQVVSE